MPDTARLIHDLVTCKPWLAETFSAVREVVEHRGTVHAASQECMDDTIGALCEGFQFGNQNTRNEVVRAIVELYSGVWSGAWFYQKIAARLPGVKVIERFTPQTVENPPVQPVPQKMTTHQRRSITMNVVTLDGLLRGLLEDPLKLIDNLVNNTETTKAVAFAAGGLGPFETHVYTTKPRLHLKLDDEYGDDRVIAYSSLYAVGWVTPIKS